MATIIEQLLGLLDENEKKSFAKKLSEHPELIADDAEAGKLLEIYRASGSGDDDAAAKAKAEEEERQRQAKIKADADAEEARKRAAAAGAGAGSGSASTDSAAILAKLTELNSNFSTEIKTVREKMVSKDDLPKLRDEMLATSIKASDDYATVREEYRAEFGKPLDRAAFEKFIQDQQAAGTTYRTDADGKKTGFQKAMDAFVAEDRIKLRIDKGVEEGVKQKTSGQKVPGSTGAVALSAAQQVIAKAKATAAGGQKTNLQSALDRLNALDRSSDERASGAVN